MRPSIGKALPTAPPKGSGGPRSRVTGMQLSIAPAAPAALKSLGLVLIALVAILVILPAAIVAAGT